MFGYRAGRPIENPEQEERIMKKIALFVILAYAAIFILLAWPVTIGSFYPKVAAGDYMQVYTSWIYWILAGTLLLCQAGLLLIPVKIMSKRPVSQKHIALPVIVSGFLIGALSLGIAGSIIEFVQKDKALNLEWQVWTAIACCIAIWIIWSVLFYRLAHGKDPQNTVLMLCRRLTQGSVIALLVAVPTHIVARYRDYCCAGFLTFIGITFGLSVFLISFGPGIYFLYAERWKKLHPQK
jgi:hypothetical protein